MASPIASATMLYRVRLAFIPQAPMRGKIPPGQVTSNEHHARARGIDLASR